jgi:hypothetical protein
MKTMVRALICVFFFAIVSQPLLPQAGGSRSASRPANSAVPDSAKAPDAAHDPDIARARAVEDLKSLDKEVTHLEAGVVIMLAVAALVVTVLFGTVIYGEIRITRSVEDLLRKAHEVAERFPKLVDIEKEASRALRELEVMFGAEDWLDDRYASLEISDRQRILTVEHSIALGFAGRSTAPQLRGMANFYHSKYKAEKLAPDLDRALYYALAASEKSEYKFQYLNDLGLIYADLAVRDKDARHRQSAARHFKQSKEAQPAQQRCYYNISILLYEEAMNARKDEEIEQYNRLLDDVRRLLTAALRNKNWELDANAQLSSLIQYNLACCLCRIADLEPSSALRKDPLLDKACEHLENASNFRQTKREVLHHDLSNREDGDLYSLGQNQHYAAWLARIRANFERSWT